MPLNLEGAASAMSHHEFANLISRGESQTVEFKTSIRGDEELARVFVAFANSKGGTLVVGVDASGKPIGIPSSHMKRIVMRVRMIGEALLPIPPSLESLSIENRSVLLVHIPPADESMKPIRTASGEVYTREGDRIRRIDPSATLPTHSRMVQLFVAMSFRFEQEPALHDYFESIKRAVKKVDAPIDVIRMDQIEGDYEISANIETKIQESDIVLADFTLNSPNVYYEAGIARGKGKHLIRTARKETEVPFDLKTWKMIFYINATQLEAALEAPLIEAYATVTNPSQSSGKTRS